MSERDWTDDAELLAQALDAGSGPSWGGYQSPDGNVVVVDGTYDATAVLNFIRAAAWDEGAAAESTSYTSEGPRNPYRFH